MKNILYLLVFLLFTACSDDKIEDIAIPPTTNPTVPNTNDFEMIMKKIRAEISKNPDITAALKFFDDNNGFFTDIDYSNEDINWIPIKHIERLTNFVYAYTNSQNAYFQNESIYNKIVQGLEYWYDRNPNCKNWWSNQIDEPKKIGILLIQMRTGKKQIPAELEAKTLKRIWKDGSDPAEMTGANQTDVALYWIYCSCLEENHEVLTKTFKVVFEALDYTTGEGIQHDNSFAQHGQQLYIGSYGEEFLKGITKMATYANDSQYALSPEKLQILSNFLRNTYYRTIRGQNSLFNVLGRGISRMNATEKSQSSAFAKSMPKIDPEHTSEYRAIISRLEGNSASLGVESTHTYYFRTDYTLYTRPKFTFDVRTVSTRTSRCEYGNGENLKGYFLADGSTNIAVQGDEYANIFPCWNWARIPGVTSPQMPQVPLNPSAWQCYGTSKFTGGVSDGIHGASTYSYTDNYSGINTSAKKSWFFFEDEVVCLGAGISSTSAYPLQTTINQCLQPKGATIQLYSNKVIQSITNKGESNYESPNWVLYNQVGYIFPKGGTIYINNQTQEGAWSDINTGGATNKIKQDIFALGFDHGTTPKNATYAYIVVPGMTSTSEMKTYAEKQDIEILENTDMMQIVRHKKSNIWQMIFYQKASFMNKDITVKVDKACVIMFKYDQSQNLKLYIADPAQAQMRIQVNVSIPAAFTGEKSISCEFTGTGLFAGATKEYSLK